MNIEEIKKVILNIEDTPLWIIEDALKYLTAEVGRLTADNFRIKTINMELVHSNDELGIIAEQLRQENERLKQFATKMMGKDMKNDK